jgi:hypothetical protein
MPAGIKLAQQQLLDGLAIVKAQVERAGQNVETTVAGLEMYEALFKAMDKEITHFAAGLQLKPDGSVRLVSRSLLAEKGVLAKLAGETIPFDGDLFAGLPADEFFLAIGFPVPEAWSDELIALSFQMLKMYPGGGDLTQDAIKKLMDVSTKSMQGMRSMAMVIGTPQPDVPLYGNFAISVQVEDAEKYLNNYEQAMQEMIRLGKESDNPLLKSYTIEQKEFEGRKGLKLTMDMSVYLGGNQPPEVQPVLKAMFGDASQFDVFLVPANPTTVVGSYISPKPLPRLIQAANGEIPKLSEDPHFKSATALLLDNPQCVALWSPRGTAMFVGRFMSGILGEQAPAVPEFPQTSPIGFAGRLTAGHADTVMAVPADTIQAAAQMIQRLSGEQE